MSGHYNYSASSNCHSYDCDYYYYNYRHRHSFSNNGRTSLPPTSAATRRLGVGHRVRQSAFQLRRYRSVPGVHCCRTISVRLSRPRCPSRSPTQEIPCHQGSELPPAVLTHHIPLLELQYDNISIPSYPLLAATERFRRAWPTAFAAQLSLEIDAGLDIIHGFHPPAYGRWVRVAMDHLGGLVGDVSQLPHGEGSSGFQKQDQNKVCPSLFYTRANLATGIRLQFL